jgi:endonuclease/exonuclease/phosphatase family metal-dependent hydrolase
VLRVLTLNIWNLSGPWRERRVEVAAWLTRLAPDVVCLQEVVQDDTGRSQADWLAAAPGVDELGYHVVFGPGLDLDDGRHFGNAVLTRAPVTASECVALPSGDEPTEGRVVLHVRTAGTDVFSTHLNWQFHHGVIREAQVLALVDAVDRLTDPTAPLPPIVAGDLNAEPDSTEVRFLAGRASLNGRSVYFQDAWRVAGGGAPGFTWDNRNPYAAREQEPDRRIDYVLVGWRREDGAGRVEAARVVCNRTLTGCFASDHFGLLAEIATS